MLLDSSRDVLFLAAKRTAFGAFGGALKDLQRDRPGHDRRARRRWRRPSVRPDEIDQVIFGNVLQTTPEDVYCARHIGLRAGLPVETPGADRQPPVRLGLPGDRHRGAGDPHRRRRGGAGRRHRVDEPGAARHPRRALGLRVRQGAARSRICCGPRSPTATPAARWAMTAENRRRAPRHRSRRRATRTRCSRRSAGPRPTKPGASATRSRPSS